MLCVRIESPYGRRWDVDLLAGAKHVGVRFDGELVGIRRRLDLSLDPREFREHVEETAEEFQKLMEQLSFISNSPTLMKAGTNDGCGARRALRDL